MLVPKKAFDQQLVSGSVRECYRNDSHVFKNKVYFLHFLYAQNNNEIRFDFLTLIPCFHVFFIETNIVL